MPNFNGAALPHQSMLHVPNSGAQTERLSVNDHLLNATNGTLVSSRWQPIGTLGQIVVTPDEQPIRTIITGRRRLVTGSYASRKAGRAFPFECMNEQAFFMHSEVDTDVVDYRAQPFRFELVIDGKKRVYIADCVRLLSNGSVEVIEVKSDRRALRDPDYALKLERVGQICDALDWSFRIVLAEELFSPKVRHENVVEVQSQRTVSYGASDVYTALDALRRAGGMMALGKLAEALGGRQRGTAVAHAMMVGRLVATDLMAPLSPDSIVVPVSCASPRVGEATR
jgi:hypothetical protein